MILYEELKYLTIKKYIELNVLFTYPLLCDS